MGTTTEFNPKEVFIEEILEHVEGAGCSHSWDKCCIYRLPWCLDVEDNNKAYMPRLVSLGPYHHGEQQLEPMEFHKLRALHCRLNRANQVIKTYINAVKEVEQKARACYKDFLGANLDYGQDQNKFVEMLVVDGCFILEIFLVYMNTKDLKPLGYTDKDPIFSKQYMRDGILRDIILLENQIPMFVLERLHGLLPIEQRPNSILELAVNVFLPQWVTDRRLSRHEHKSLKQYILSSSNNIAMLHCLDIFRQTLMYPSPQKPNEMQERSKQVSHIDSKYKLIPSAVQLNESGVKFKSLKGKLPFWDLHFEAGVLEIPQVVIYDGSKSMFLNLMAFEQCHLPPKEAKITSYIAVLDNLINSPKDVAQLIEDEVIVHTLGSDEAVADMFNCLGKGIYFSVEDGSYVELYKAVNEYHNKKYNQWRATVMHNYFNSPWAFVTALAGATMLVLSLVKTIKPFLIKTKTDKSGKKKELSRQRRNKPQ